MTNSSSDPRGPVGAAGSPVAEAFDRLVVVLAAIATPIVILAIAVLPFLTPAWITFGQERAGAAALTGYTPDQLRSVDAALLHDLVIGPPVFDVAVDGTPVLNERERGHLADVRVVFGRFYLAAGIGAVILAIGWVVSSARTASGRRMAAAIRLGAATLGGGILLLGAIALVAFDVMFELFHRLFFPPGTYTFDPSSEQLVRIFPGTFWAETTVALAIAALVLVLLVGRVARPRARS